MQPDAAGSPSEWLRFAESDLAIARVRTSEAVMLEALCLALKTAEDFEQ